MTLLWVVSAINFLLIIAIIRQMVDLDRHLDALDKSLTDLEEAMTELGAR